MKRISNLPRRSAFTLVEILVVICIIGILASLLMAALFKARSLGEDLEARNDIAELHKAIGVFCNDQRLGALGFMPSKFDPAGGDPASLNYITRLFPRADTPSLGPAGPIEGHQCLVFFLSGPNGNGFSTNPRNPLDTGGDRIGPFFDFKQNRLVAVNGGQYRSYQDRFGTPIAYFSATQWSATGYIPNAFSATDNQSLNVKPYFIAAAPQTSPNITTWQLISAGRDKAFGNKGDIWTPSTSQGTYPRGDPGFDDIANFSNSLLGAKQ